MFKYHQLITRTLLLSCFIIVLSGKDGFSNQLNSDSTSTEQFIFPMHVGNVWVYGSYDGFNYSPNQRWEVLDTLQEGDTEQCALIRRVASSIWLGFDVEEFNLCMNDNMLFFHQDRYLKADPDSGYYPIVDFNKELFDRWIVRDVKNEEENAVFGAHYYISNMTSKQIDSINKVLDVSIESYYVLENFEPAFSENSPYSSFESGVGITKLEDYVMIGAVIDGVVIGDTTFVYPTSIDVVSSEIPNKIELVTYPNPFNPSVTIQFTVPNEESVSVRVFNSLGQVVETLWVNQGISAGTHTQVWSPSEHLSSGVYFVRLEGKAFVETRKVTLQK